MGLTGQLWPRGSTPGPSTVNVRDFGAAGDGTADDAAAIQAAVDAVATRGGVVRLPRGTYRITTALNLASSRDVALVGDGGRTGGAEAPTWIVYQGSDGTNILNLQSAVGTTIRDMMITHDASFTGRVIDVRNVGGSDPAYITLSNLYIGGSSSFRTAVGVDLDKATRVVCDRVAFYDLAVCVRGKSIQANYSNQVTLEACGFNRSAVAIHNPGSAWAVRDCTFEGSATAVAAGLSHDAGVLAESLLVQNCWSGDTTSGTVFVVAGTSITFVGNWIGATGGNGINANEITTGLVIIGNRFVGCATAITLFASASNSGQVILANTYLTVTTKLSGTLSASGVYGDAGSTAAGGAFAAAGTITANDGGAQSLRLSADVLSAVGSNTDQGIFLNSKGISSVFINNSAGSGTGGLAVYGGGGTPAIRAALGPSIAAELRPASGSDAVRVNKSGEGNYRIRISDAGVISLGDGTNSVDTTLDRSAAGVLRTGAAFRVGQYATGSRPTASSAGAGAMVYDTTLSKPIFSDGTTWRDAAGTAV